MIRPIHARILSRCTLLALAVLAAPGCTAFQQLNTNKWLASSWVEESSGVNHVDACWQSRLYFTPNTRNDGLPMPCVAGRVYFINEETRKLVEADGKIVVQMFDASDGKPNNQQKQLGMWEFDPHSLKRLKRTDFVGTGYTLILPWEEYTPTVKKVRLQVGYFPQLGSPHYTSPQLVALQGEDAPQPLLVERPIVPASYQIPR